MLGFFFVSCLQDIVEKDEYTEIWDSDISEDEVFDERPQHSSENQVHFHCRLLALFLLSWQYKLSISDSAVNALLQFLNIFFLVLNKVIGSPFLKIMAENLPITTNSCRVLLNISDKSIIKYVSCVKCHSIYEFDKCTEKGLRGKLVSKHCPNIAFPNHPCMAYRKSCGALLCKEVQHGTRTFCHPFRTYCSTNLIDSIQALLSRPEMLQKIEHWRSRPTESCLLGDVYDGRVWQEFQVVNGRNFLKHPHTIGLMMNIDWFQPFKRTTYSIGVIYLVIMNLPRNERFLPKNVIICGIIPGPSESKHNINSYLSVVVSDLQKLWKGVFMNIHGYNLPILVRAVLLCTSSDLPATRKICGFSSYNSTFGCSKCLKHFTINVGQKNNYSEYDRENWERRTKEHHKHYSLLHLKADTKSKQNDVTKNSGVRYSILQELEYFDPVRFHVVDPMHNLLLGTAKHALSMWIQQELISPAQCNKIQEIVDSFSFPSDIGRIPYKITSGFSGFTADQWRTWTVILSPVVLKGILPLEHYSCWSLFVEACFYLCT